MYKLQKAHFDQEINTAVSFHIEPPRRIDILMQCFLSRFLTESRIPIGL